MCYFVIIPKIIKLENWVNQYNYFKRISWRVIIFHNVHAADLPPFSLIDTSGAAVVIQVN